jgi:hypothetical protein
VTTVAAMTVDNKTNCLAFTLTPFGLLNLDYGRLFTNEPLQC